MSEISEAATAKVSLLAIFLAFLRLGCTSFGGGTAAWVYRDIVQRRGWIDEQSFLPDLAIGQGMPGSNGINMAVLVGRRLKGGVGAFVAPFAMLAGPFAIILAIGAIYGRINDYRIVHAVLDGVVAAVVGLSFSTGVSLMARTKAGPASITIAAITVLFVGIFGWPILPVMLGMAPISIGIAYKQARP